jgi:hypothetical protein
MTHRRDGVEYDQDAAAELLHLAREAAKWERLQLDQDQLAEAAAAIAIGIDPLVAVRGVDQGELDDLLF